MWRFQFYVLFIGRGTNYKTVNVISLVKIVKFSLVIIYSYWLCHFGHWNEVLVFLNAGTILKKFWEAFLCKICKRIVFNPRTFYYNLLESSKPRINQPAKNITVPPASPDNPVIAPVGADVTALPNSTISLDCPSGGNPPPTVTWYKDGVKVISKGRATIHVNGTLTVLQLHPRDSGRYMCRVENVAGSHNSTSQITVKGLFQPFVQIAYMLFKYLKVKLWPLIAQLYYWSTRREFSGEIFFNICNLINVLIL